MKNINMVPREERREITKTAFLVAVATFCTMALAMLALHGACA